MDKAQEAAAAAAGMAQMDYPASELGSIGRDLLPPPVDRVGVASSSYSCSRVMQLAGRRRIGGVATADDSFESKLIQRACAPLSPVAKPFDLEVKV
ncbi:hypothetical protein MTO96_013969 [Rhipicephalus appendiculatus]